MPLSEIGEKFLMIEVESLADSGVNGGDQPLLGSEKFTQLDYNASISNSNLNSKNYNPASKTDLTAVAPKELLLNKDTGEYERLTDTQNGSVYRLEKVTFADGTTKSYSSVRGLYLSKVTTNNLDTGETSYYYMIAGHEVSVLAADAEKYGAITNIDPWKLSARFGSSRAPIQTFDIPVSGTAVCFCSGTMIQTAIGQIPVEDLSKGDMVLTRDNGYQPIQWIGKAIFRTPALMANSNLYPIRIKSGALGENLPKQDLWVSRQHRIMVRSKIASRVFKGAPEVLVAANQLTEIDGIDVMVDVDRVEYYHILFERHEIIFSNNTLSESLYPGPEAIKSLSAKSRQEIFEIFPELATIDYSPRSCRELARGPKGWELVLRHKKSNKPLINGRC